LQFPFFFNLNSAVGRAGPLFPFQAAVAGTRILRLSFTPFVVEVAASSATQRLKWLPIVRPDAPDVLHL
jgi:hypothetical protein